VSNINWNDILGWGEQQIEDLRFVAFSYIKQGHYDTAVHFFEALAILSPANAYDQQTLGALYLQKGNTLEALRHLDKAIELDPTHYPSLLNRSKALFLLGHTKQAVQQARQLEICDNPDIAKQATALILSHT
jgi:tetratricopeptide (TPR) repeat protein